MKHIQSPEERAREIRERFEEASEKPSREPLATAEKPAPIMSPLAALGWLTAAGLILILLAGLAIRVVRLAWGSP